MQMLSQSYIADVGQSDSSTLNFHQLHITKLDLHTHTHTHTHTCSLQASVLASTPCLKKLDTPAMSHNSSKNRTLWIIFQVLCYQVQVPEVRYKYQWKKAYHEGPCLL